MANQPPTCAQCGERIAPPDTPVVMAKPLPTTATGTGREWADGLRWTFHAEHAPREITGLRQRVA